MTLFQGAVLVLMAAGLACGLWSLRRALFRGAVGGKKTRVTVVVTSEGSPGELEQSVKGLLWLIESGALAGNSTVLIKDAGMGREAAQMARILERDNPSVKFEG